LIRQAPNSGATVAPVETAEGKGEPWQVVVIGRAKKLKSFPILRCAFRVGDLGEDKANINDGAGAEP